MRHTFSIAMTFLAVFGSALSGQQGVPEVLKQVVVFDEPGRYGGWPANNGIWSWGDEILVGFSDGYFHVSDRNRAGRGHTIDYERPVRAALARSIDGGETWEVEYPPGIQSRTGITGAAPNADDGREPRPLQSPMPLDHPDFAMRFYSTSAGFGEATFCYSVDRGRTWEGPFIFPMLGFEGIQARTDYEVQGPQQVLMFTQARTSEGGPVISARSDDGGLTWRHVSTIGGGNQPSTVRFSDTELFTALRGRRGDPGQPIVGYRSLDGGQTWSEVSVVADQNAYNPASLVLLRDGRLVATYGYRRAEPVGIRARISTDRGASWGDEILLRSDGTNFDLGYTQTVQRPDGLLVTVYYFNDNYLEDERYIAATIWDPGVRPAE